MNKQAIYQPGYATFFEGKVILITGSVGTVGDELIKQLLSFKPSEIRLYDNNESGLYMQVEGLKSQGSFVPILGDVRDLGKLNTVMDGVDIVFHLAAYKHVYLCEYNPFDSVRTNVIGTQNVLMAALSNKVERLLYTSTDKAVNPTNVMGTSKLLAERVVTATSMQYLNGRGGRIFTTTRFGNVIGSNGSVVPVFAQQIKRGGPVTVTDERMTRFIMTAKEAARLVIKAMAIACGGEVFVTKMPVIRIIDLAEVMIELLAPVYGYSAADIKIDYVGVRPGEKLYEELLTEEEISRVVELDDMFSILPALKDNYNVAGFQYPNLVSQRVDRPYISKNETPLSKEGLKEYLLKNSIVSEYTNSTVNIIC